jgi:hypothetical protein
MVGSALIATRHIFGGLRFRAATPISIGITRHIWRAALPRGRFIRFCFSQDVTEKRNNALRAHEHQLAAIARGVTSPRHHSATIKFGTQHSHAMAG